MLAYLTALNLVNYLDRYLLAALLPTVRSEFNISYAEGGTLISAFVIGYVLCSPLFGYFGDRHSRPRLMAAGVLLWSVATALSGLATGFYQLLVLRILVGVGEGSFATLAPGFIKDRCTSPSEINKKLTVFFIAIPVGSALGYVVAGQVSNYFSWHYAFFFGALPGLVLATFLFRLTDLRPQRDAAAKPEIPMLSSLREAFQQIIAVRALRFALVGYAFQAFALNGIASFITSLGVARGYKEESISQIFGLILVVTGLIGTTLGGRLSTRGLSGASALQDSEIVVQLFRFLGRCTILAVPFLVAAFLIEDRVGFLMAAAVAELLIFAGTAPVNSIIVMTAPQGLQGLTQGITITTLNLFGALLGPILVGKLADLTTLAVGLQLTSFALFLAAVFWTIGARKRNPA